MPQPTLTPQEFVAKWRQTTLKEKASAQEHFIDLCHLIGHPTPADADPLGESFTFEAGADKTHGGQGFADVWKRYYFAWEYKGKHANLDKAYQQLLQYREALLNPPLLIVCDIDHILVHTNFTNTVKQVYTLTLEDLLTADGMSRLRAIFHNPSFFKAHQTVAQVTEQAAREFARLADQLRAWGNEPQAIAHFLIRLLFCLFAEDTGLLPNSVFTTLIQTTRTKPAAFVNQTQQLFNAMSTGGWFGVEEIPFFDGGLFDNASVLELDSDGLAILMRVSGMNWANMEPSILGTLFERSLDPSKRSQLGAHYTSREDIELIVEPVLMAPLRREWEQVQEQARDVAVNRDETRTPAQRTKLQNQLNALLKGFADRVAEVQVLDPACGSGNFLYIALKRLLDLQKEVMAFAGRVRAQPFFPSVKPAQLHGIEINPYAYELAQATVWIGYIQWLQENGFGVPPEPILKPLHNFQLMDAILAYDEQGRPMEPAWPAADVIIGNPPFLGSRKMRPTLGDEYCNSLLDLYGDTTEGLPDLVCYWFEKAERILLQGRIGRVGLLATQSIRGGTNRKILERITKNGNIFMAWSDRPWILDGAVVHVAMVGFDDGTERSITLDGRKVQAINPDLTSGSNLPMAHRLLENRGISFQGVVLRGPFSISFDQSRKFIASQGNPNHCSNQLVLKPKYTGQDITRRWSNEWVIDFGVDIPIEEAMEFVEPFEYVKKHVYPMRQMANQAAAREKWWLHWNQRIQMRKSLAQLSRYVATPAVAKHRLFVWLDANVLPDHQVYVFSREDDYFLGVLHSRAHELWSRRLGTQLRDAQSGFRYTSTTTFETFPFPWLPGREPADDPRLLAIAQAAKELVAKRDTWLNPSGASEAELKKRTLTNLYNQRPTWLDLAHRTLDAAVFDAYGWPHDLTDEQILERLLALNLERAASQENQ